MPSPTSSRARSGALDFWSALPRDGRWLLSTVVVQFFGRGLTLPFTIIYLHEVRGFPLALSGTLMGLVAVAGLAVTGPAGWLVDRVGARVVVLGGLASAVAGCTVVGLATTPLAAAVGLALFGVQLGVSWPALNALVATVVVGELRQRYFGVSFALLNLGIGVGGVVGGFVVDVERPGTFVAAFLINAATFVAPAVVLLGPLRHLHGRAARPAADAAAAAGAPAGYLAILRRPEVAWLTALSLVAAFVGYGQMEGGFPAFARQVSEVSTRAVGMAFVVNTCAIVLLQFWVMNRARGHRRTRVLVVMAGIWAAAWGLLGLTGLVPGTVAAVVGVLAFHGVFGLGETLLQAALPAVVNDMAPDHLRGRYNAVNAAAFQGGTILGPVAAGVLLQHGAGGAFVAVVVACCVALGAMALVLEHRVSDTVNGVG